MPSEIVRKEVVGKVKLRLGKVAGDRFTGRYVRPDGKTALVPGEPGETAEEVWARTLNAALAADPSFVGFEGARARFLHFFPKGFQDEGYLGSRTDGERRYKLRAKGLLDAEVPVDEAVGGSGFGRKLLQVFGATNLLSGAFELTKVREVLLGEEADLFVRAAAAFALGDETQLSTMSRLLRPYEAAKWPIVTYLPFLWRPDEHMFLKPNVTKFFAGQVGHAFSHGYRPELSIDVYRSLLDLTSMTEREIQDLMPRDRIDVQSFIWVVGEYRDEQLPGAPPPAPVTREGLP